MSDEQWFYVEHGRQAGPVAFADLRAIALRGDLKQSDLVWREGFTNWREARTVGGLFVADRQRPAWNPAGMLGAPAASLTGSAVMVYAGFWLRFVAAILDGVLLMVVSAAIQLVAKAGLLAGGDDFDNSAVNMMLLIFDVAVGWLYGALMESSHLQATLGKMALGIQVTTLDGERVSFARASGRHFAKYLSMLSLFIGYIMAGLTKKKQALHDIVAACLVVRART